MKRKRGPLDDIGGAKELADYRLSVAKEDLADAERNFEERRYRSANNINRQRKILIALTIFLLYNGVVHEIIMGELFRG